MSTSGQDHLREINDYYYSRVVQDAFQDASGSTHRVISILVNHFDTVRARMSLHPCGITTKFGAGEQRRTAPTAEIPAVDYLSSLLIRHDRDGVQTPITLFPPCRKGCNPACSTQASILF